jgi:tetratricopeptide (TPR) repeat protein
LQQGRNKDAIKLLEDISLYARKAPSSYTRGHQIFMKTTYLIESEDWDNPLSELETDHDGLNISVKSRDLFVHALKAYKGQDFEKVRSVLSIMEEGRLTAGKTISLDAGIALCSSGGSSRENATPRNLDIAEVMEMELKALLAWSSNDWDEAEKWFKKATGLEEKIGSAAGPPVIVKPSHELYAEFLMAIKREKDAIHNYDKALKLAPNRKKSVMGKQCAEEILKQRALM